MSRSIWASTEHTASASAERHGDGEQGQSLLAKVASSAKKCFLMMLILAGLVDLAIIPASALADGGSPTSHHAGNGHPTSAHARPITLLTFGTGYSSPNGSPRVVAMQRRLARAGFSPGPFDGRYGVLTQRAVMRFQAAHGLVVDGVAGPVTLGVLRTHGAVLYPGNGMAGGASGQVRRLQRRLARAGFSPGTVDGRYGPRTEAAVARFQARHHLAVDGIAGPVTLGRLAHQGQAQGGRQKPTARQHPTTKQHPATNQTPAGTGQKQGANGRGAHPRTHQQPAGAQAPSSTAPSNTAGNGSASHPSSNSPSLGVILLILALAALLGLSGLLLARNRRAYSNDNGTNPDQGGATARNPETTHEQGAPTTEQPPAILTTATNHAAGNDHRADDSEPLDDNGAVSDPSTPITDAAAIPDPPAPVPQRPAISDPSTPVTEPATERADETAQTATHATTPTPVSTVDPGSAKEAERVFAHGAWLDEHGDHMAAMSAYRRADAVGHAAAAANLGVLLEQQGDLAQAEHCYRRASERGDANGAFNLAVLFEEQGRSAQAMNAYQRADHLGHAAAPCNLGVMLEQAGNARAAEVCYRRADERGDAHGAFNLAVLLEEHGDNVGALRAYRRASHRSHPEIAEMARLAAVDLKQRAQPQVPANQEGARNGG